VGIIVVANRADEHGEYLIGLIRDRGHRVLQLSAEAMSQGPFAWRPESGLSIDMPGLGSERWAGVWRRSGSVHLEGLDPRYEAFARSEWFDACEGALLALPAAWLTPLASMRSAELKLVQLAAARQLGIRIPETIVTNDPDQAMTFARSFRCIAKPVRYGLVEVDPPMVAWTTEVAAGDLQALSGPPIILQQLVVATKHLRVVTIDHACFVAELTATELDWRSNLENHRRFRTAGTDLTAKVSEPARGLARLLGLGFSSQDWLVGEDGELFFLDVNPNGQWMFVGDAVSQIGAAIVDALEDRIDAQDAASNSGLPH
jgi:hypothetical protein